MRIDDYDDLYRLVMIMQRRDIPPLTIPSQRRVPFGGSAYQSREIVVVPDMQDMIQGMGSPSLVSPRNSSTPNLALNFRIDSPPSLPPSPRAETAPRPNLSSRKTSPPSFLTINSTPLSTTTPSSPSFSMPMTPPPSPLRSSSRPPSRESTKSLPVPIHTSAPPNFPRAFHRNSSPAVNIGIWQNTSVYGEAPQFSRYNIGSNVVMPISAKGRQEKATLNAKPNWPVHSPVTSTSSLTTDFLAPPPLRRHAHSRPRSNSTGAVLDRMVEAKEPVADPDSLGSLRARTKSVLSRKVDVLLQTSGSPFLGK
ncbi:hypothetical protein J3R30DRAFT_1609465 [Lentinula aciculospora]|uniref:Uncharacterized protein n=1 Tax=Lentinula aciculospora TaxID=153920 RepID=A0A9W8ZXQ4_9AGAR|nr:hypothetical protein J3R30DRAFT_1609465 [Lentinula aciculospora]